jgi:hypothetical protein
VIDSMEAVILNRNRCKMALRHGNPGAGLEFWGVLYDVQLLSGQDEWRRQSAIEVLPTLSLSIADIPALKSQYSCPASTSIKSTAVVTETRLCKCVHLPRGVGVLFSSESCCLSLRLDSQEQLHLPLFPHLLKLLHSKCSEKGGFT